MLVPVLTVRVGAGRVLLGLLVLSVRVVVRRLQVMVGRRVMMAGGLQVVFDGGVLVLFGHDAFS
jgi:hypothetical protein